MYTLAYRTCKQGYKDSKERQRIEIHPVPFLYSFRHYSPSQAQRDRGRQGLRMEGGNGCEGVGIKVDDQTGPLLP